MRTYILVVYYSSSRGPRVGGGVRDSGLDLLGYTMAAGGEGTSVATGVGGRTVGGAAA